MFNKVIFQGHLEFGTERSYSKAVKMFEHLVETRFKTAILLDVEEDFNSEELSLDLGRRVLNASEKYFRNSVELIEYVAQFAINGYIGAWMREEDKITRSFLIEPKSDKIVVQAYLKGRQLADEKGMENEALEQLNLALKKYDKHSRAYERRAFINYKLNNIEDAIYDYTKSISLDKYNEKALMGRAMIYFDQKKFDMAESDVDAAIAASLALQDVHWTARRYKAMLNIQKEDWQQAMFNLKLFVNRTFVENSPNIRHLDWARSSYGEVLLKVGEFEQAIEVFNLALAESSIETTSKEVRAKRLLNRGLAKQKLGGSGFLSDFEEAANLGLSEARKLIAAHN